MAWCGAAAIARRKSYVDVRKRKHDVSFCVVAVLWLLVFACVCALCA